MNIVDLIELSPTFGAAMMTVREKRGLGRGDLAALMKIPESALREIELGFRLGEPDTARVAGTMMGLSPQEIHLLTRRRMRERLNIEQQRVGGCAECSSDAESSMMHAGPGKREDDCRHIAECIDRVARYFPKAEAAHCPGGCTRRDLVTRAERLLEAMAYGAEGPTMPAPCEYKRMKRAA